MRFANPGYTLGQLKALFEQGDNLLGKGRQGSVVRSDDGMLAIKRQSLTPSEQEQRFKTTPAGGAYMTARVGQEGLGPRVVQYEEDPAEGFAYMAMENLAPQGYQTLKSVMDDEEKYRSLYAQQQVLEARAARAGINLQDTSNSENVMFNPETGDIRFIDQGFSKPLASEQERNVRQVIAGTNGLNNLDQIELANEYQNRLMQALRSKDEAGIANLAADTLAALQGHASSRQNRYPGYMERMA